MRYFDAPNINRQNRIAIRRSGGSIQLHCGYSLVELVVVIVIVGVLAAVSAPLFFNTEKYQERGFFDETVAAVRYAQKYAIASGCTVRVELVANTGYRLWRAAGADPLNPAVCNGGVYATALTHPNGQAFANNVPSGVNLSAAIIDFATDGSASPGATINVGGRSFTVVASTGFVRK